MNTENLKALLGHKIDQCTNENFMKGYDPICDLIDELEGINIEYLQEQGEFDNMMDDEEYYEKALSDLAQEIFDIETWRKDFNGKSINLFKRWFFMRFNYIEYLPTDIHLNLNWSNELTRILMDLSLIHLNDDYGIHRIGGSTLYFWSIYSFLIDIAKVPLDNGFINVNEIINRENEELAEQFMFELENRSADCTYVPEFIEVVEFKSEEWYEDNKWDEDELRGKKNLGGQKF